MSDFISAAANKYVKMLRELNTGKGRAESDCFIVEGMKFVEEIPENWEVASYAVSESFVGSHSYEKYMARAKLYFLRDVLFKTVSGTVNPQGILAVCKKYNGMPNIDFDKKMASFIICDRISDPGNMGTIIRSAHAFGCDAAFISDGSADIYNPKIIRASAGSFFHINCVQMSIEKLISTLKAHQIKIIAAHLKADKMVYETNLTESCAIVIGNEANGVSNFTEENADSLVKIPMPGEAESLNASVACGVMLYELARQRIYNNMRNFKI